MKKLDKKWAKHIAMRVPPIIKTKRPNWPLVIIGAVTGLTMFCVMMVVIAAIIGPSAEAVAYEAGRLRGSEDAWHEAGGIGPLHDQGYPSKSLVATNEATLVAWRRGYSAAHTVMRKTIIPEALRLEEKYGMDPAP
jgi:hypothetical protein